MTRRLPALLLVLVVGLVGLGACGESNDSSSSSTSMSAGTTPTTATSTTTTTDAPATVTAAPTADETAPADPADGSDESALAGYEEYPVLRDTIPDLGLLTPFVETDNPNTRVILFRSADGQARFKAVLVKRTSQLKIIAIDTDGPPLYDAPL